MIFVLFALAVMNLVQAIEGHQFLRQTIAWDKRMLALLGALEAERDRHHKALREIVALECDLVLNDGSSCGYCGRCDAREIARAGLGVS